MYTIMMADIIKSREIKGKGLMNSFTEIVESVNKKHQERLLSPLTVTLGDEFQGIPDSIDSAVEIFFDLEEMVIMRSGGYKLRYVILEGEVETSINPDFAHGMLGKGLTQARESLEVMKESEERVLFYLQDQKKEKALNEGGHLYQWIVDDWNEKDRELVRAFWEYRDYKTVAKALNKNVSLMWKREKSLQLREYRGVKQVIRYMV